MQLSGRAVGGPLDNVMLCAPHTWLGIIHHRTDGRRRHRTDGRYQWDVSRNTWRWSAQTDKLPPDDVRTFNDDDDART